MTLEQLIRENGIELTPGTVGYKMGMRGKVIDGAEYIIRVQMDNGEDGVRVYVRPSDRDGDTVDFLIKDNQLTQL